MDKFFEWYVINYIPFIGAIKPIIEDEAAFYEDYKLDRVGYMLQYLCSILGCGIKKVYIEIGLKPIDGINDLINKLEKYIENNT